MRSETFVLGGGVEAGAMVDTMFLGDSAAAQMIMAGAMAEGIGKIEGTYKVWHFRKGKLIWWDTIHNLVTTVGKNFTLDTIMANSAGGAVVMGLCGTGTKAVGDTQASHAGWLEVGGANAPAYSGTRKTPSFSAASSASKTVSAAVGFTFTSGGTVAGCFINIGGSATQDNTTGTLFSAGDFTGGSRVVATSDVINVTYTVTIT